MTSKTFHIFYHSGNQRALPWAKKIRIFLKKYPAVIKEDTRKPEVVIALGGDGTILETARKYHEIGSIILGLNLGHVGFLASVRNERDFFKAIKSFLNEKYGIIERMMLSAQVERRGRIVFSAEALNDIVIKNPLGIVELEARVAGHLVKHSRGTGILIATATGSTAYNLSAHGPIVMPDIKCIIITELLGHSIPSPSVVVKYSNPVSVSVVKYKKSGTISLSKSKKKTDVLLMADGDSIFPLEEKDKILIQSSPHLVKFAEFEKNYFFKSLKEKFGFR